MRRWSSAFAPRPPASSSGEQAKPVASVSLPRERRLMPMIVLPLRPDRNRKRSRAGSQAPRSLIAGALTRAMRSGRHCFSPHRSRTWTRENGTSSRGAARSENDVEPVLGRTVPSLRTTEGIRERQRVRPLAETRLPDFTAGAPAVTSPTCNPPPGPEKTCSACGARVAFWATLGDLGPVTDAALDVVI